MNASISSCPSLRSMRYEMRQVKTLLSHIVDPSTQQHQYVCVAGSAALLWFLLSQPGYSAAPEKMFRPNDIDVFVYGTPAASVESFSDFVESLTTNIETAGYAITSKREHSNWYVLEGPILIIDVRVEGIDSKISFVQSPNDHTPQEVVSRFDMDIVQVIYDVKTQTIKVGDRIRSNILRGQATTKNFVYNRCFLSLHDYSLYGSTLSRISKYSKRGFVFPSIHPPLQCSLNNLIHRSHLSSQLVIAEFFERNSQYAGIQEQVQMALTIMRNTIPNKYLRNHKVGICGENLLQCMLDSNCYDVTIPAHVEFKYTYRTERVWMYVCSEIAPTQTAFFAFVRRVRRSLWRNGYPHVLGRKRKTSRRLQNVAHTTCYSLRISNMDWLLDFVWSPGTANLQQVAEKQLLGIHQMWLNYNTMTPVMTDNVKQQLQTATCHVQPIQLCSIPRDYQECNRINFWLFTIEEYYECGWRFLDDFKLLPPVNR